MHNMTEDEYKAEWLQGKHQTEYNNCRFADDKLQFAKVWLDSTITKHDRNNILVDAVYNQKLKLITDKMYCKLCERWTDKISVKAEIRALGLAHLLIDDLFYSRTQTVKAEDIKQFIINNDVIIKCNHGSGWNKIIKHNASDIVINNTVNELNSWLSLNYAYITGYEAQYENIIRGILVQKLLIDKPLDYSFWCINGEITKIGLTKKLGKNLEQYIAFVNPDYTMSNECIGMLPELLNLPNKFKDIVNSMKADVLTIAKPFDFVRVDMYHVNSKNYFGETTFTPCGGKLQITKRN